MSVKDGLLAVLSEGPSYGNHLRAEFERRTAGAWSLNVGQVYSTLTRLERDGLVTPSAPDDEGRILYTLTDAGREHLEQWWVTPKQPSDAPRDDVVIKLAMALSLPEVDVLAVLSVQRTATMSLLQELTRAKVRAGTSITETLALEHRLYTVEAELRWLDHLEARLTQGEHA